MRTKWLRILMGPTLSGAMGEAARRHVTRQGSLVSMTDGYSTLVERLCSRGPAKEADRRTASPGQAPTNL